MAHIGGTRVAQRVEHTGGQYVVFALGLKALVLDRARTAVVVDVVARILDRSLQENHLGLIAIRDGLDREKFREIHQLADQLRRARDKHFEKSAKKQKWNPL